MFKVIAGFILIISLVACSTTRIGSAYDKSNPEKFYTGVTHAYIDSSGYLVISSSKHSLLNEYVAVIDSKTNAPIQFKEKTNRPQKWVTESWQYGEYLIEGLSEEPIKINTYRYDIQPFFKNLNSNKKIKITCVNCKTDYIDLPAHLSTLHKKVSLEQSNLEVKRKLEDRHNLELKANINKQKEISRQIREGDGSPDDSTCKKFGFKPQTSGYAECRLKLEVAARQASQQQQQYEEQKREYDAQVAAVQKEKDRQRALKQLEMGLRMMSGQSVQDAAMATSGMPPIPKPPGPVNQTIIMPGGRMVNCTTTGTVTHCF